MKNPAVHGFHSIGNWVVRMHNTMAKTRTCVMWPIEVKNGLCFLSLCARKRILRKRLWFCYDVLKALLVSSSHDSPTAQLQSTQTSTAEGHRFNSCQQELKFSFSEYACVTDWTESSLESLSNHDGDGKENVTKQQVLISKTMPCTCRVEVRVDKIQETYENVHPNLVCFYC